MLGAAHALGYHRGDLNLTRGDMCAPGWVPGVRRTVTWTRLGLVSIAVLAVGASIPIALTASRAGFELLLVWLPAGLYFAVVNPVQEEIRFRLVPLATLVPAVGPEPAIWMTATVFGFAHWSQATPSGPVGLAVHLLLGAWLAKSIVETRGVAWAWILHALGNLVVFTIWVFTAA